MGGGIFAAVAAVAVAAAGLGASGAWVWAARRQPGERRQGALLAASAAVAALGSATPTGAWSAPAHCAAALLLLGALARYLRHVPGRERRELVGLDGALAVVSAMLIALIIASPAHPAALSSLTLAGWGRFCCDVVVLCASLLVLVRAARPQMSELPVLLPLSFAAVGIAVFDLAVVRPSGPAVLPAGGVLVRLGSVVSLLLLVTAAQLRQGRPSLSRQANAALSVLAGFVPGFLGVVVIEAYLAAGVQLATGVIATSFGLGLLLFLRLVTALADNRVLVATLESQVAERTLDLVTREQWFRALVQNSSDSICVVDRLAAVRYQSPAFQRVFGHDAEAMVGTSLAPLLTPEGAVALLESLASVAAGHHRNAVLELDFWHRDGRWCHTETVISSLLEEPTVRGLVLNIRDISDRRQLQDRLTHEAYHDALTGLANRALLQARLSEAVGRGGPGSVAVLFCDLDGFKAVNDSRGHETGDALLQAVAGRLENCVRAEDMVARFGGDEFAVVICDRDAGAVAAEIAERVVQSVCQPFHLNGAQLRIGTSVGIAVLGPGARTAEELLRNADLAMYRSKAHREVSVTVFKPAMHDALLAQIEVEDDLREAMGRGQLVLHYQTTVDLNTRRSVGAEALMRWYHPERGIVAPEQFIAVAEEKGYIQAMGRWALHEAARQGMRWQEFASPGGVIDVAVNISPLQVVPALVDHVREALTTSGLPPAALVLEVTESVLLDKTEEAAAVFALLKELGVRVAVDDFGTGYSSLSYLSRFPVDILKIDRQFVERLTDSEDAVALTRTIVNLGQALGLTTIAEGVENWRQVAILQDMGCSLVQGYLFCRPLPATGMTQMFALDHAGPPRELPDGVVPLQPRVTVEPRASHLYAAGGGR